jgi:hypothetical protein
MTVAPTSNPTSGTQTSLVTWTPSASYVGTTSFTFDATNQFGTTALTVTFFNSADVPVPGFTFTNTASPTFNVVGFPIGLQITDASNTPSTYSVVSAPNGVSIDPNTGVVNWVPTVADSGNATLTFQLTNSAGTGQITVNPALYISDPPQNVTVTGTDTLSPTLSWSPPNYNTNLVAGYYVWITGPDFGQETFTTSASTLSVPLSLWSYPGTYQVNIAAMDASGNLGLWNTSLSFAYAPNLPNPTYAFTSNGGGAYAVIGQPMTIQVTDQNTSLPSTFSLVSGTAPDGMTVDPSIGVVTWTATLADLGATYYPVVAVTNAVGESDITLTVPVVFASPVNNVAASFASGGSAINVTWTDPTIAAEPIAGYNVFLSWIDGDGYIHYAATTFVAYGSNTSMIQKPAGDAASYTITVVAVNSSGNEGAYPLASTTLHGD